MENNYEEAINQYTRAIEISKANPNHIYYANRANAYLKSQLLDECITDCDEALKIEPLFIKAYLRKALALFEKNLYVDASQVVKIGLKLQPDCDPLKEL